MDTYKMRNNYNCAVCSYSWLSSKVPKRCSNPACRSMKWNNQPIIPVADFPIENKKNSAASPTIEEPYDRYAMYHQVQKKLDPDYEPKKMQTLEEMRAMIDAIPAHKSVLPEYKKPVVIEDQPSFDELNTVDYGEI